MLIRRLQTTDGESFMTIIDDQPKRPIYSDTSITATGTIMYERKFIHNNGGHIEDVCVKESYRKLGLGKQWIRYLLQESKKNCYTPFTPFIIKNTHYYKKLKIKKILKILIFNIQS